MSRLHSPRGAIRRAASVVLGGAVLALSVTACGGEAGTAGSASSSAGGGGSAPLRGKQVTLVVPYDAGGGFDVYARALAPYLEQHLEGARVTVRNEPGGGGLIGAKNVYDAAPDGTTIGLINYPGSVFAVATGKEGVSFDNSRWTFLGRVAAVNPLFYSGEKSGIRSAQDLIGAQDEVVFGIGGVGSDAFYAASAVATSFGFPHKIIAGYEGSGDADVALLAGEVDVSVNSIDSALQTVESGASPLTVVSSARSDKLPDVPTVVELAQGEEQRQAMESLASIYDLERVLVAPPGMDSQLVEYLRAGVSAAFADPKFAADLEKAERTFNPLSGAEAQQLAEKVQAGIDKVIPLLD